jgi:hypothetical protein
VEVVEHALFVQVFPSPLPLQSVSVLHSTQKLESVSHTVRDA